MIVGWERGLLSRGVLWLMRVVVCELCLAVLGSWLFVFVSVYSVTVSIFDFV